MSILIKSFGDFSWLPNSTIVGIETPTLMFMSKDEVDLECSGFYSPSSRQIVVIEDEEYEDLYAGVIAHEMMHHIQEMGGRLTRNPSRFDPSVTYEAAIHKYFNNDACEYEALLFQHSVAKDWESEWWLEKLVIEGPPS